MLHIFYLMTHHDIYVICKFCLHLSVADEFRASSRGYRTFLGRIGVAVATLSHLLLLVLVVHVSLVLVISVKQHPSSYRIDVPPLRHTYE
jgi:hypothetical protein